MISVTSRFLNTVAVPHRVATVVTVQPPGEDAITLKFKACTVSAQSGTGIRRKCDLVLDPIRGFNLYDLVSIPGSIFHVDHGFVYSATQQELIPVFDGEASTEASPLESGGVSLSLWDRWARVERSRFTNPFTPPADTRAGAIGDLITDATGPLPTDLTTSGGSIAGTTTWDQDRAQAIKDIATDGGLEAYVDSDTTVVVRPTPTLDPSLAVWTVRSNDGGTLKGGTRERPLDRMYNTVVVKPSDDTQTWDRQVVAVTNPNHPRYPGKIGTVPFFWSSPTITSAAQALAAGQAILSRVLGTTEKMSVTAVANPALEPGDVINVANSGPVELAYAGTNIIDSFTLDCVTGSMDMDTRSSDVGEVEEAA